VNAALHWFKFDLYILFAEPSGPFCPHFVSLLPPDYCRWFKPKIAISSISRRAGTRSVDRGATSCLVPIPGKILRSLRVARGHSKLVSITVGGNRRRFRGPVDSLSVCSSFVIFINSSPDLVVNMIYFDKYSAADMCNMKHNTAEGKGH
jgi:hypothetical protein